jgi:hypothetical protein
MSQLPANLVGLQVTTQILTENPSCIFVFGDNTLRRGNGGAAILRHHPQSYGFITKRYPTYEDAAFYRPEEYQEIYKQELEKLKKEIINNSDKTFLISLIGAGLANRYKIFETVIEPSIKKDLDFPNVKFLW